MLILLDNFGNLVGDTLYTHAWLLVIGRNLGRGDHMALLIFELLLNTTVEEERDVRILLRLCMHINTETYDLRSFVLTSNVGLLDALFSEPLSKDVGHGLRRERDGEGEFLVVAGHGGDVLRSHVSLGLNPRR